MGIRPKSHTLAALAEQMRRAEAPRGPQVGHATTGCAALDALLPEGGLRRGTLVEWLGDEGSGATVLAAIAARAVCGDQGMLVVVDRQKHFYPPAAAHLGLSLERTMVVQPREGRDYHWALHQALRCSAVAAVLCWPSRLDDRAFRRLQLAAEAGGGLGFLVRPENGPAAPTWAEVQLNVQAIPGSGGPRRFWVELVRARSGTTGRGVHLELDDETHTLHLAPQLALAAVCPQLAGA